jgi:hypothetical protein
LRREPLVIAAPAIIAYASSLAGTPVAVTCNRDQSFGTGELGYTLYDAQGVVHPTIYLPASTCNRLNALAAPSRLPATRAGAGRVLAAAPTPETDLPDGAAVDTLLHEATHIREQSTDEARVECDAYRNRWSAVKLFRLSGKQNRSVLRGVTASHLSSPADYLRDC